MQQHQTAASLDQDAQVLLTIQSELYNMGKSLQCPLCLSTLRNPVMAICLHAFCRECILTSLNGKQQCPVCKFKCTKRGLVPSDHLADLVKGFKLTMRAFGFAPVVYSEGMAMTQLIDDDVSYSDDEADGEKINADLKGAAIIDHPQTKGPSLLRCHEHLEVSKAIHSVLQNAVANIPVQCPILDTAPSADVKSRKPTRESSSRSQNEIRLRNLLRDQEKIIEVDQQALLRAAVTKSKNHTQVPDREAPLAFDAGRKAQEKVYEKMNLMNPIVEEEKDKTNNVYEITEPCAHSHELPIKDQIVLNEHGGGEMPPIRCQTASTQDRYEASMEDTREKEIADRSAEILLQFEHHAILPDNNEPNDTHLLDETISRCSSESGDNLVDHDMNSDSNAEKQTPINTFSIGTLVCVQARTWPGVNKQGGVGRIIRVHEGTDASAAKYDVSYVLGGRERYIDGLYISLEIDGPDQYVSRGGEDNVRADPKHEKENVSVVKQKGTKKKRSCTESHESSKVESPDQKMLKTSEENSSVAYFSSSEDKPTVQEISERAVEVYKKRCRDELLKGQINIVTSGLNESEMSLIKVFCAEMQEKNLKIKISNDINPQKTALCISSYEGVTISATVLENVAKHRTLKLMRSSISGIPIMTMSWVLACIESKDFLEPSENYIVHTLPAKNGDLVNSELAADSPRFGVVRLASYFHPQSITSTKMLESFSAFICGQFKTPGSPKAADIQLLLKESGAKIIISASECVKRITASTKRSNRKITDCSTHGFVFICDDASMDSSCGISSELETAFELALDQRSLKLMIVTTNWLFDSIACGSVLNCDNYEPNSPRAKALWLKAKIHCERMNC